MMVLELLERHWPRLAPLRSADTGYEGRPPARLGPIGEPLCRQRLGITGRSPIRNLPSGWELVDLGDRNSREARPEEVRVD